LGVAPELASHLISGWWLREYLWDEVFGAMPKTTRQTRVFSNPRLAGVFNLGNSRSQHVKAVFPAGRRNRMVAATLTGFGDGVVTMFGDLLFQIFGYI
jgi:hypothetical protein